MATAKISQSQHPLGTEDGLLDWLFKPGIDCVLDSGNRKFYRTLRIGSSIFDQRQLFQQSQIDFPDQEFNENDESYLRRLREIEEQYNLIRNYRNALRGAHVEPARPPEQRDLAAIIEYVNTLRAQLNQLPREEDPIEDMPLVFEIVEEDVPPVFEMVEEPEESKEAARPLLSHIASQFRSQFSL